MKRAVLTVATGKPIYWDMAVQLARSFEFWNAANDIQMFILTDQNVGLPKRLRKTTRVSVTTGSLGRGFSAKLQLDRFLPADETLFIDADCLCVGSIEFVFERFVGHSFSVVGGEISAGEWFGDVRSICSQIGVPSLPKFNGGLYYIRRGTASSAVYECAREMEPRYDELGLVRLRGLPNDELLIAIAMALEGCSATVDDGLVMGDFMACPELVELDVPTGRCVMRNPRLPDSQHRPWFPLHEVRPAVVHFLGHHISRWPYRSELVKMRALAWGIAPLAASYIGRAYSLPFRGEEAVKRILRPSVHALFGPRSIKTTVR